MNILLIYFLSRMTLFLLKNVDIVTLVFKYKYLNGKLNLMNLKEISDIACKVRNESNQVESNSQLDLLRIDSV